MIHGNKAIVIPMKAGTIFINSAYIVTPHQQVKKEFDESKPLTNIWSYNLKCLLSNMSESFCQDISAQYQKARDVNQIM